MNQIPLESGIRYNPHLTSFGEEELKSQAIGRELALLKELNLAKFTSVKIPFLLNRNGFEEMSKRNLEGYKGSFVVAFFDGDNFKSINDTHGHEFGDKAMIEMAMALKESSRKREKGRDVFGHVGGDEFCVVLMPEKGGVWNDDQAKEAYSRYEFRIKQKLSSGFTATDKLGSSAIVKLALTGGMYIGNNDGNILNIRDMTTIADTRLAGNKKIKKENGKNWVQIQLLNKFKKYLKSHGQR